MGHFGENDHILTESAVHRPKSREQIGIMYKITEIGHSLEQMPKHILLKSYPRKWGSVHTSPPRGAAATA